MTAPDGRPLVELADIELETELLASRQALHTLRRRARPGVRPPRTELVASADARNRAAELEAQRRNWF